MKRRQRDLGGPDEKRRDRGGEALVAKQLEGEPDQRQLEHRQVTQQVGKARPGRLSCLLHLDPAVGKPELEVVAWLEVEARALPDLAQRHGVVFRLALGRLGVGEVRQRGGQLVPGCLYLRQLGLELLQARAYLAHLGDQRLGVVARPLRRGDLIRGAVLPRPALLHLRQELAAALIEPQELVQGIRGTSPCKRRPGALRILADAPEIEHQRSREESAGHPGVLGSPGIGTNRTRSLTAARSFESWSPRTWRRTGRPP